MPAPYTLSSTSFEINPTAPIARLIETLKCTPQGSSFQGERD